MGIDLDGSITRGKVLIIPGVVFLDATRNSRVAYLVLYRYPSVRSDRPLGELKFNTRVQMDVHKS